MLLLHARVHLTYFRESRADEVHQSVEVLEYEQELKVQGVHQPAQFELLQITDKLKMNLSAKNQNFETSFCC